LVYAASTRTLLDRPRKTAWNSTLTIGALGLSLVGDLQDSIHDMTNSTKPLGWGNQISDGGELTAKYTLSQQKLISSASSQIELKSTLQASVGYITEALWEYKNRLALT